jgi:hypothetical protein
MRSTLRLNTLRETATTGKGLARQIRPTMARAKVIITPTLASVRIPSDLVLLRAQRDLRAALRTHVR